MLPIDEAKDKLRLFGHIDLIHRCWKKTFTLAETFQNIKLDGKLKRPFVKYAKNLAKEKLLMWYLKDIKDKIGNENSECRLAVMQKRTSIVYSLLKVIWID